jgi:4-hydroxybenzoate polyprenyltransferase
MLIVSSILISPVSFIIVFGAVVYLASYEFFGFKKKVFNKRDRVFFSAISVVIFLAGFSIASDDLNFP